MLMLVHILDWDAINSTRLSLIEERTSLQAKLTSFMFSPSVGWVSFDFWWTMSTLEVMISYVCLQSVSRVILETNIFKGITVWWFCFVLVLQQVKTRWWKVQCYNRKKYAVLWLCFDGVLTTGQYKVGGKITVQIGTILQCCGVVFGQF